MASSSWVSGAEIESGRPRRWQRADVQKREVGSTEGRSGTEKKNRSCAPSGLGASALFKRTLMNMENVVEVLGRNFFLANVCRAAIEDAALRRISRYFLVSMDAVAHGCASSTHALGNLETPIWACPDLMMFGIAIRQVRNETSTWV